MRRLIRSLIGPRISPQPNPGPTQLRMLTRFDSLDLLNVTLPAGYHFVEANRSRHSEWAALVSSAGDLGHMDGAGLKREILSIMVPGGGVLIANDDKLVACSAICFAARFAPYCLASYVLVHSDHRGVGLGRALGLEGINRGRVRGYPGMVLQTDDSREAAIGLYLSLGFAPVTDASDDAPERWSRLMGRLRSPSAL